VFQRVLYCKANCCRPVYGSQSANRHESQLCIFYSRLVWNRDDAKHCTHKKVLCGLDSSGSRKGQVVGSCEHGNEYICSHLTGTSWLESDNHKAVLCRVMQESRNTVLTCLMAYTPFTLEFQLC